MAALVHADPAGRSDRRAQQIPGRDLHEAHADLHITGAAFDRVAWHLQRTLRDLAVQQEDQQAILAAVQARGSQIVTFEES